MDCRIKSGNDDGNILHRLVMAGLVPAIHDFRFTSRPKTWMPGPGPEMSNFAQTRLVCVTRVPGRTYVCLRCLNLLEVIDA
jgi:hypothetical protein